MKKRVRPYTQYTRYRIRKGFNDAFGKSVHAGEVIEFVQTHGMTGYVEFQKILMPYESIMIPENQFSELTEAV